MIAANPTPTEAGPRRPRKDPTRISAQEYMILIRMKRIDRGQGCHAAVDRIGCSFDDRHQSFSTAQTRRHIRRLRELGEIHFAGQTPDGRNVYLFPERTYRREDVPIDLGRPVDYLRALPSGESWSTEKAAQILKLSERGEVASRVTLIDEYPVNRQILKSHSETTIRHAIHRLKATYPTFQNIKSPSALLRHCPPRGSQRAKRAALLAHDGHCQRNRSLAEPSLDGIHPSRSQAAACGWMPEPAGGLFDGSFGFLQR